MTPSCGGKCCSSPLSKVLRRFKIAKTETGTTYAPFAAANTSRQDVRAPTVVAAEWSAPNALTQRGTSPSESLKASREKGASGQLVSRRSFNGISRYGAFPPHVGFILSGFAPKVGGGVGIVTIFLYGRRKFVFSSHRMRAFFFFLVLGIIIFYVNAASISETTTASNAHVMEVGSFRSQ